MGHMVGKDVYRKLGKKVDNLTLKAPWNDAFYEILKTLYTTEEADVVVKMPFGLSKLERISRVTKINQDKLRPIIEGLCKKGLVVDVCLNGGYNYMPSPLAVGIFEFTMMRTGDNLDSKGWARLFHNYMQGDGALYTANCSSDEKVSLMRSLPHEETIKQGSHVEVLDYEKASSIVMSADKLGIGLCSCRHEKMHVDEKECDAPLDTCTSFGYAADYLIRNNMAREVSRSEMMDHLARSKEMGLVLNADNVQKKVTFICNCCGCCCNILLGFSKYGCENIVVTSSFIAEPDNENCIGCGKCARACPINAIEMEAVSPPVKGKKKRANVDQSVCIGCGVCALQCEYDALHLVKREQRVLHPETTFHRVILQCLERGTLQNQIFDNPQSITQSVMRGIVGAFFKLPPVKKALFSDTLRSRFLKTMESGVKLQGKGWLTDM